RHIAAQREWAKKRRGLDDPQLPLRSCLFSNTIACNYHIAAHKFAAEEPMNRTVAATAAVLAIAVLACAALLAQGTKNAIKAVTPDKVQWFTPTYYTDGRQRAQLFGDSSKGGPWIDRVKVPSGGRVLAHTHPEDE